MGRTFASLRRLRQITAVLARHGLDHYLEERRQPKELKSAEGVGSPALPDPRTLASAQRFRNVLEELGPTFIKFGQVLSTRGDLLPPGFAEALTGLQDHVAPLPAEALQAALKTGLRQPLDSLCAEFDLTPMASASIAQVHRAKLHSGQEVAVKVQRPHIRQKILEDLDLLRVLAQLAEAIIDESGVVTPRGVVDEFESALLSELNFAHEAQMIERFAANIAANAAAHPRSYAVPQVFLAASSDTVLTMELIRGARLSALPKDANRKRIACNVVSAAFEQLLIDGLFHADPHPGNCFILEDNRLALIDFGSVGELSYATRETLVVLVVSIGLRDASSVARLLYRVAAPDSRVSLHRLRDAIASLFDQYLGPRVDISQIEAAALLRALFDLAARFRLRIPSEYALVARASMTVEGIIRQLDPRLEVLEMTRPLIKRLLEEQFALPEIGDSTVKNLLRARDVTRELPLTASQILMDLQNGKLQIQVAGESLESLARNIDALGVIIFMGLVAGGAVCGSLFILARYNWLLWGLPVIPMVALYIASTFFGATVGRFFLSSRVRKISVSRWLSRRRRSSSQT